MRKRINLYFLIFYTFLCWALAGSDASKPKCGHLLGFVYGEDCKTPLQDAIVLLKGMAADKIYQSKPTGKTGDYRITDIDDGTYIVGLKINEKTFNVDGFIKVTAGKTEIISLALEPPPDPAAVLLGQGWCCHNNKVFKSTSEECNKRGGDFFATKKEAQDYCGTPLLVFFTSPSGIAVLITGTGIIAIINSILKKNPYIEISPTEK